MSDIELFGIPNNSLSQDTENFTTTNQLQKTRNEGNKVIGITFEKVIFLFTW